jgi:hypothetical protein
MTVYERVVSTLRRGRPDHLPFVGRLDVWHACHRRSGSLPPEFRDAPVEAIHSAVGMGRQRFLAPFTWRLHGVEMVVEFNGQPIVRERDPLVDLFCGSHSHVRNDVAGETVTRFKTPRGGLQMRHAQAQRSVDTGTEPYLREHLIKDESDFAAVAYLWENAEYVPLYADYVSAQADLADIGFVVPLVPRVPFQQVLLEYLGEVPLFYALQDSPKQVARLMELLDEQLVAILNHLVDLPAPYVEFPDNLHGLMTNPVLFKQYNLVSYQRYSDILHRQGKLVGSHTDGDVKRLLPLLKASGLDVCESFSPAPLTACTFDEAWRAWQGGPIIWGGIPSPLLEERTPEAEFHVYLDHLLDLVGEGPIVLCVVDMVMGHNSLDRMRHIAERVQGHLRSEGDGNGRQTD